MQAVAPTDRLDRCHLQCSLGDKWFRFLLVSGVYFNELPEAKTLEDLEALLPWNLSNDILKASFN